MLKSILFRRENWLILFPFLFFTLTDISIGNGAMDIHLHDTYYIITTAYAWLWVLLVVFLPYFLHVILRTNKKGKKLVLNVHVYLTLLCYIAAIAAIIFSIVELSRYGVSNWKEHNKSQFLLHIVLAIYLMNQIFFFFYFISKLLVKK